MTRVLVCGGRRFGIVPLDIPPAEISTERARAQADRRLLDLALSPYLRESGTHTIIHGAAQGADAIAARWAERHNVPVLAFPSDWKKHGKAAGPIRNARMLAEARPDIVIAFPGGTGTADMTRRARAVSVEVVEVRR